MRHGRTPENMPARTSRIKTHWYTFHAATTSYSDAHHESHRLRQEASPEARVYYMDSPGDSYYVRTASPSQRNWPEVKNVLLAALDGIPEENRARYAGAPVYIIWRRIKDPLTLYTQDQDTHTHPAPQDHTGAHAGYQPTLESGAQDQPAGSARQDQDTQPAPAGSARQDQPARTGAGAQDPARINQDPPAGAPMPPEPPITGAGLNRVAESRHRQDQESEFASQPRLF